jgi:hypothetical protein
LLRLPPLWPAIRPDLLFATPRALALGRLSVADVPVLPLVAFFAFRLMLLSSFQINFIQDSSRAFVSTFASTSCFNFLLQLPASTSCLDLLRHSVWSSCFDFLLRQLTSTICFSNFLRQLFRPTTSAYYFGLLLRPTTSAYYFGLLLRPTSTNLLRELDDALLAADHFRFFLALQFLVRAFCISSGSDWRAP